MVQSASFRIEANAREARTNIGLVVYWITEI